MFAIIVLSVIAIAFVIALATAIFAPARKGSYDPPTKTGAGILAGALLVVGLVTTFIFSATTVDSRAVGIQTSFGRYVDTLPNGFHMTAPWSNVEEFTTRVQPLYFDGSESEDEHPHAAPVRVSFDGGAVGEANITVNWRINPDKAEDLWTRYREFDAVRKQLVEPEARNAFRTVFSTYTPNEAIDGQVQRDVQESALADLRDLVKDEGVLIDSVSITRVDLSDRAQDAVNRIVEAEANTERATAEQERAKIEAETNKIRQESQTEEALQRYCLEVVNAWDVAKNGPLPATFNCVLTGSQTPVIVGQN